MAFTRADQTNIIVQKIVDQLGDQPGVQKRITESFTAWFQGLVEQGLQMIAPAPQAAGGGEAQGEANGDQGNQ